MSLKTNRCKEKRVAVNRVKPNLAFSLCKKYFALNFYSTTYWDRSLLLTSSYKPTITVIIIIYFYVLAFFSNWCNVTIILLGTSSTLKVEEGNKQLIYKTSHIYIYNFFRYIFCNHLVYFYYYSSFFGPNYAPTLINLLIFSNIHEQIQGKLTY